MVSPCYLLPGESFNTGNRTGLSAADPNWKKEYLRYLVSWCSLKAGRGAASSRGLTKLHIIFGKRGQHLNSTNPFETFIASFIYFRLNFKCRPLIWASFSILYAMISVTVISVSYSAMSVWFGPAVEGDNFEVSLYPHYEPRSTPPFFQMLYKVVLIAALLIFLCQALLNGASVCK